MLAGCAGMAVDEAATGPQAEALWQTREFALRDINGWAVKGRLAIKTSDESWTASLHWAQKARLYMMRIIAPFGQGTYEIKGGHGKVSLLTDKNEVFEAADPHTLMTENLGWSVPLLGMQYWILGVPDPDLAVEGRDIDSLGRLIRLDQSGWTIQLTDYRQVGEYELPGKISMENDLVRVRLVIHEWVRVI